MDGGGGSNSNVPAFLTKLWTLVEDPETDPLICWSPVSGGEGRGGPCPTPTPTAPGCRASSRRPHGCLGIILT